MTHKRSSKRKLLRVMVTVMIIVMACFVFVYLSINRLLSTTLHNGFKNSLMAEVYELNFKDVEANLFTGSIKIINVDLYPRENELHHYDYINSSFHFDARNLVLSNVNLIKLLFANDLELKKIEIVKPNIKFTIADSNLVFFPLKEFSTDRTEKNSKPAPDSYAINELTMVEAHLHVVNVSHVKEFIIQGMNISLKEIVMDREQGLDKIAFQHVDFSLGKISAHMKDKEFQYIECQDIKVNMDSLHLEKSPDTLIYHFSDANSSLKNLDIQTTDSLFHFTIDSFHLHYKYKSVDVTSLSFQPNITDVALQKRYAYRKENFAATAASLHITDMNFDSLMYARKMVAGEILIDNVSGSIYKDLTKPFPPNHHPKYLGQQIQAYSMPVVIQHVKVTNANLFSTEVTPDGGIGKVNINRGTLDIENISSLDSTKQLIIHTDAFVENSAHVYLQLMFNYDKSQFSIKGKIDPFEIPSLNAFTSSYASVRVTKGMADGITFSGMVYRTHSIGTMKVLYHDLVLEVEDKAKWKSSIRGLAVNTFIKGSNPSSSNTPVRVVQFDVERDMRTGFINMLVKSVLDGIKETVNLWKEKKQKDRDARDDTGPKIKVEKNN